MWRKIINKVQNQSGFTVIEMLISVVIVGIVGGAIAMGVAQTFTGSTSSSTQMTAINNVKNAGDWIIRDAQQARGELSVLVPDGTSEGVLVELGDGDEITFIWYDYDPTYPFKSWTRVIYTIPAGTTDLQRTFDIGTYDNTTGFTPSEPSENVSQSIIVAQNITRVRRSFTTTNYIDDIAVFLTVEVTAEVGAGSSEREEIRTFEIRLRPKR